MRSSSFPVLILLVVIGLEPPAQASGDSPTGVVSGHARAGALQSLVDELRQGLALDARVAVSVVPVNSRAVSVRPPADPDGVFHLSIEEAFLDALSEDELAAALAHELGHVWVFTHHPYLQTERLANEVAMRLVSRDSLERVYHKVWQRDGVAGDVVRVLGP